jgi:hypothetical protein
MVLARAVTVRLNEEERTAAGAGVVGVFTTKNPNYANSIFLITKTQIIRRYSSGSKTVVFDFAASGLAGVPRTAAIHPTKPIFVLGWTRPANAATMEGNQWFARNETHARATPATFVVTVSKFGFAATNDNQVDVASKVDLFQFGAWDAATSWDLGEIKFQTVGTKTYLWVPTANSYPQTLGIWDFYQQGREAGNYQGKLLRFDLDQPFPFTPLDNPFLNTTVRNSVYATGFVWPTAVLFTETNDIWATDHQSAKADEINMVTASLDYGWNIVEGASCVQPPVGCSTQNTVAPKQLWNLPAGYDITYGISGGFYYGQGQFLLSWNGTSGASLMRHFNATDNTASDVDLVDERGVSTRWYYSDLQLTLQTEGSANSKWTYVIGNWFNNDSSVLFTAEVVENGAAHMSILAALIIAVLALLH